MQNLKDQLDTARREIDTTDNEILSLFVRRMNLVDRVADIKKDGNLSIVDEGREKAVLQNAAQKVEPDLQNDARMLMSSLIALSRQRQKKRLMQAGKIAFPSSQINRHTAVGYQGVTGAWSEQAAITLYPDKELRGYGYFEDVFTAVRSGEIGWGVLPIENSQSGAIGEVYDLLRRYGCYIVGQVWVEARQCLLAKKGARLEDIREVLSHPEGFRQCHQFLKNRAWDKIPCNNTAVAAQTVAAREDIRAAAIGSRRAAEAYGLEVLQPDIMDNARNRTRFIAIAAAPYYTEESNTVSVTFSTAHKAGALCSVLETFMAAGVNLTRIESRPAGADKYRFFADLEANILTEQTENALGQAAALCEYFEVLGCYSQYCPAD